MRSIRPPNPEPVASPPRTVVEVTDLGSALTLLSDVRKAARVHASGSQFALRLARASVGPVGIDQVTFGVDLDVDFHPAEQLIFGQVKSGALRVRAAGTERRYGPGELYLASQPGQRRTSAVQAGEHEQAVIDPALFSQVAGPVPGRADGAVRFTGYAPASRQAAEMWKSTYGYVRDHVLANPAVAGYPLLVGNAARLLAVTALSVFPNDARAEPAPADRNDGSPATLRRAVAFIDEHAHEDITAADIAAAASVTIRAVQLAFRRHLETTPTAYLRQVRLSHAHQQLVAASVADESVTAVSYQWGFSNPSRFAAAYRKAYGVSPSRTLRG